MINPTILAQRGHLPDGTQAGTKLREFSDNAACAYGLCDAVNF